jgi:hypothetical protein
LGWGRDFKVVMEKVEIDRGVVGMERMTESGIDEEGSGGGCSWWVAGVVGVFGSLSGERGEGRGGAFMFWERRRNGAGKGLL